MVGAHLSGMVLNGELKALGGRLLEATATASDYKLYALSTTPPKPGMLRAAPGAGSSIAVEVWALSAAAFGKFVAAIPPPLSIGTVRLADGRGVKGFIVEPADIEGARDISSFGGWRRSWRRRWRCSANDEEHSRHESAAILRDARKERAPQDEDRGRHHGFGNESAAVKTASW